MKKIFLPEFRDYCNKASFSTVIFSTHNQSWDSIDSTISADLEFNKIIITFNPNTIHLIDRKNYLRLNKVKAIKLCRDKCLLGKVFTVICGDSNCDSNDKEYTLIAR